MKKHILIILTLYILLLNFPQKVIAATQIVDISFPSVNNVAVSGGNLSTSIDPITGNLSSELSTVFSISTNYNRGLIADFSAKVNSMNGIINAIQGTNAGSNIGTGVLANTDFLPNSTSIQNALSANASSVNNPNAVGYEISFENQTGAGNNPVFAYNGSQIATGYILYKKGSTTIIVKLRNNPSILAKTYNNSYDTSGSYQMTIYCTVYNP